MKNISRLVWTALIVAWIGDQLFWGKVPGLSILLIVGAAVGGGLYLAWGEKVPPARVSWVLLGVVFVLFGFTVIRREPVTTLTNTLLGALLLMVFTDTFRDGGWVRYGFIQYATLFLHIILSAIFEPTFLSRKIRKSELEKVSEYEGKRSARKVTPVLRGILIALPIVWIFASLLSSADLVFAARMESFFSFFNFERWYEHAFRATYIVMLAYLLCGVYLVAFSKVIEPKTNEAKTGGSRQLGFTEAIIVLGSVNLLFIAFVLIQVQYFFGVQINIVMEGYTYATYARRGFGELVTVAIFSLMLFFVLSGITKREGLQKRYFSGLGVIMALLIAVILVSAFQRLLLYEDAYGFTRLRTYPHVFMVWLGILLAVFVALEIAGRERYFALATLIASLGFAVTLNVINVDGLIVNQNLSNARGPRLFDQNYLLTLSTDATPALFQHFDDPETPQWLREQLGFILACQSAELWAESAELSWSSYHFSRARAAILFLDHAEAMIEFPVFRVNGSYQVEVEDERVPCETYRFVD